MGSRRAAARRKGSKCGEQGPARKGKRKLGAGEGEEVMRRGEWKARGRAAQKVMCMSEKGRV